MSNEKTLKSLKERAKAFANQLPLMENREKGDMTELLGQITTITDYGFLPNDTGEPYIVFTVAERPETFYFGGSVLTARMLELDAEGYRDAILEEGLPVLFKEVVSKKSKRKYIDVIFYPED